AAILVALGLITIFMGYKATQVELDYNLPRLLPDNDSTNIAYNNFKKIFGSQGNVVVLGIKDENLYELEHFNAWYDMGNRIIEIEGVEAVASIAHLFNLYKNSAERKFEFKQLVTEKPKTQLEVDSLKELIGSLRFYDGVIYNRESGASLMAITLDRSMVNSENRKQLLYNIRDEIELFEGSQGVDVKYSGLPYIRTGITVLLKREMRLFTFLAALFAAIILYMFFRSVRVVAFSLLIVIIGVVWSIGSLGLFGFKITGLSALLPPLIIIIGITNCIYLLNKYHNEYRSHGNKEEALQKMVVKIGSATFMTNATTAIGFATFMLTGAQVLREFGLVASLNIILIFVLSILMIPIIYSLLPPPEERHTKHLDYKGVKKVLEIFTHIVINYRKVVYLFTALVIIVGIYGVTKMETTGNLSDDLPKNDPAKVDLQFFEKNFGGVMPFEILIDTKKKRGVMKLSTIKKMDRLGDVLREYPEFSSPISVVEVVKFSKQAYYGGNESRYSLPDNQQKNFILSYASKEFKEKKFLNTLMDSTKQLARISVRMADLGTHEIQRVMDELTVQIDSIFDPEKYEITLTGTTVVYLMGTSYLVKGLFISLALAIFLISLLMAGMFYSFRMVMVSLVPNLIPLLLTASIMGYFGISIKPSTILVFSVALGISVDNTIHFLAKYRQELKSSAGTIYEAVITALNETGVSIIYTFIVLLFGFGIFSASDFGGTQALGMLVSITLFMAVLANLLFLPSLLLSLEKTITTKSFKDPAVLMFEDDDIELEDLEIPTGSQNGVSKEITSA
ncbi:MAG TPA: RND family transporter, partial [Flavobacteriales bacterium]|nr:RND family transporter [Flavobacteriales bacterium]